MLLAQLPTFEDDCDESSSHEVVNSLATMKLLREDSSNCDAFILEHNHYLSQFSSLY
jgi:hypothetical protein